MKNEVIVCEEECGGCSCFNSAPCTHCMEHVHDGDALLEEVNDCHVKIRTLNKEVTKLRRNRNLSDWCIIVGTSVVMSIAVRLAVYFYSGALCKLN